MILPRLDRRRKWKEWKVPAPFMHLTSVRHGRGLLPALKKVLQKINKNKYIFVIIVNINRKTMLQLKRLILISLHTKLNKGVTGNSITNLPLTTLSAPGLIVFKHLPGLCLGLFELQGTDADRYLKL